MAFTVAEEMKTRRDLAVAYLIELADGTLIGVNRFPRIVTLPTHSIELPGGLTVTIPSATYDPRDYLAPRNIEHTEEIRPENSELDCVMGNQISESDVRNGRFERAKYFVIIYCWGEPTLQMLVARGEIDGNPIDGNKVTFKLKSKASRLGRQIPPVTQGQCRRERLGTNGCPFEIGDDDVQGFPTRVATTVASVGVNPRKQFTAALIGTWRENMFTEGVVRFTAGPNAGREYEIYDFDEISNVVQLWHPTVADIEEGDTIELDAACDLQWPTCWGTYGVGYAFDGEPNLTTHEQAAAISSA